MRSWKAALAARVAMLAGCAAPPPAAALWRGTATQDCVQRREAGGRFRPSEPQAWFGAAVAALPLPAAAP